MPSLKKHKHRHWYAYHSTARCSEIETYFCKNCKSILLQKVKRPNIFENAGDARGEELLEYFETNGFLLMNEHEALPSVSALGYSMQDLVYLSENRKVFYCKVLEKIRCICLKRRISL